MQLLQILGLWNRTTEVVNEDGSRAVGLQQRPKEPLQEGDELLVLLGLAHLGGEGRETQSLGDKGTSSEHQRLKKTASHCLHTEAAYCSVCAESPLEMTTGFDMRSLL